MARLPVPNADTDQWGVLLNEFLRVAHNEDGTLRLEEVDATTIGVVANDAKAAQSNSAAINNFFAHPQVDPVKLVLPAGTVFIDDTINLLNRNSIVLRGRGILATILRKITDGYLIRIAGSYNYIGDMMLQSRSLAEVPKVALCGLYVQGFPQSGINKEIITVGTHLNTFRNLYIQGFRVGIRVGHCSNLDEATGDGDIRDEPGDGLGPDIVANLWQNIFLDSNRYGLVRDGDNILNDHFENLVTLNNDRIHVFLPCGGDFRCFTAQFGATLEQPDPTRVRSTPIQQRLTQAYPKIYTFAGGAIILANARSENGSESNLQPPFLTSVHAETFVEMHEVKVTNPFKESDPKRRENLQIDFQGGRATLINCHVNGTVNLANTQYIGLNNEVGMYNKLNVSQNNTIILDAAVGTANGPQNTDAHLEITELTVKRTGPTGQNGAKIHFASSATLDSGDGAFYFYPAGTATQSFIGLHQQPFGNGTAQSRVLLKNAAGNAVIATDGLNGGTAGRFEVQIAGRTVFSVDGNGNMVASGTKSAVVAAGEYGSRTLYAVESPQNWFEDFSSAQLVNGVATVTIDPIFAQTVNLNEPYHVFLTPLGDCPLYVAQKTATSFTVRAIAHESRDIVFDYRIVALRKGYEKMRLAPY